MTYPSGVAFDSVGDFYIADEGNDNIWMVNNTNCMSFSDNEATFTLSNVTGLQAGKYWVVVSNAYGSVTSAVATLGVWPQPTTAPMPPEDTLLDIWLFPPDLQTMRRHLPMGFTNVSTAPVWFENELVVDGGGTNASYVRYHVVETSGSTNLCLSNGTLVLFFAPDMASTNVGARGPLVSVGHWTAGATNGWWSLFVGAAGTNVAFATQDGAGHTVTNVSARVSWGSNAFHLLALDYSASNSQF